MFCKRRWGSPLSPPCPPPRSREGTPFPPSSVPQGVSATPTKRTVSRGEVCRVLPRCLLLYHSVRAVAQDLVDDKSTRLGPSLVLPSAKCTITFRARPSACIFGQYPDLARCHAEGSGAAHDCEVRELRNHYCTVPCRAVQSVLLPQSAPSHRTGNPTSDKPILGSSNPHCEADGVPMRLSLTVPQGSSRTPSSGCYVDAWPPTG